MEQRKYQIQKQNIKKDLLEKIIGISYILMISIILGVCLFENNIDYAGKIYIICAEPILLFGGIYKHIGSNPVLDVVSCFEK